MILLAVCYGNIYSPKEAGVFVRENSQTAQTPQNDRSVKERLLFGEWQAYCMWTMTSVSLLMNKFVLSDEPLQGVNFPSFLLSSVMHVLATINIVAHMLHTFSQQQLANGTIFFWSIC